MYKKQWMGMIVGWIVGLSVGTACAESARPWKDSLEASAISANGNSKDTTISLKNSFAYDWSKTGLEIGAGGMGTSNSEKVTGERYFANEELSYKLTERNYAYERTGWEKNRFSGFRNRWSGSAGLGRVLLDLPKDKLKGELGGGYINEERIGVPRNDFIAGRAYAKYVHAFSDTARFSQDAEYLHDFQNADDYRINTETALTAAISTHLSLKTSFVWNRMNNPVPGDVKDDTLLMAGLVINY